MKLLKLVRFGLKIVKFGFVVLELVLLDTVSMIIHFESLKCYIINLLMLKKMQEIYDFLRRTIANLVGIFIFSKKKGANPRKKIAFSIALSAKKINRFMRILLCILHIFCVLYLNRKECASAWTRSTDTQWWLSSAR